MELEAEKSFQAIVNDRFPLEKAMREAGSKDRINKMMLSMIAHEIKTPLKNINSLISLFKQPGISKEELVQLIDDSQERMDLLICSVEKLLSMGNQVLHIGSERNVQDVEAIICHVVSEQMHNILAKENTVTLTNTLHQTVLADVAGMSLLIGNLLSNANKFTTNGNISFWIYNEDDCLVIKIIDEGRGMDQPTLQSIINKLPVGSSPGTHNEKGTGTGLMLVHEYLQITDGKLYISSSVNKGSTFILKIKDVQLGEMITPSKEEIVLIG